MLEEPKGMVRHTTTHREQQQEVKVITKAKGTKRGDGRCHRGNASLYSDDAERCIAFLPLLPNFLYLLLAKTNGKTLCKGACEA
jgi:hypothetical protein